ncbi:hypothetical protein EWM64_g6486 [Hericium alpestre]|uniref:Uncharacterized protein n=1 Tax=Hericium alpestre TaxID=135208 RepID=A0A4Y9ZVM9_9AGAM|nr:hypothetical protein EWM64_g6486 [Hericium alpestre]
MATFDPRIVRALIRNTLPDTKHAGFDADWDQAVASKVTAWAKNRKANTYNEDQLEWEANVIKYVDYVHRLTMAIGGQPASFLPDSLPLYGPHFLPPTYDDLLKRQKNAVIAPNTAYLQPITVVHPFYLPNIAMCPVCDSTEIKWEGWNSKGHRSIHSLHREEHAIGVQLRCKRCQREREQKRKDANSQEHTSAKSNSKKAGAKAKSKKSSVKESMKESGKSGAKSGAKENASATSESRKETSATSDSPEHTSMGSADNKAEEEEELPSYCFSTTSRDFWQKWELWAIPRGMPVFFKRCGVTRELLDVIIEVQLHLLEYNKAQLEYLRTYRSVHSAYFHYRALQPFMEPFNAKGYGGPSISDEIISEVYLDFTTRSREDESQRYMRTIRAVTMSMDATFKVIKKATVTDGKHKRTKVMSGGLTTAINEHTESMFWEMSRSQAHAQLIHMLHGYVRRCKIQDIPLPEITVVDSCCHFRSAILEAMPNTQVVLDTYHFMMRYLAAVVNGLNNPHRSAVAHDVVDAILKVRAVKGQPAEYWSQAEQEEKLKLPDINSGETFGITSSVHAKNFSGLVESEVKKVQDSPPTKEEIEEPLDLVDRVELEDPDEVEPQSAAFLTSLHIDPHLRYVPQSRSTAALPASSSTIPDSQIDPRLRLISQSQSSVTAVQTASQASPTAEESARDGREPGATNVYHDQDLTEDSEYDVQPAAVHAGSSPEPEPLLVSTEPTIGTARDSTSAAVHDSTSAAGTAHDLTPETGRAMPASMTMKRKHMPDVHAHETNASSGEGRPAAKRACLPPHHKGAAAVSMIPANIAVPGGSSKIGS